MRLHTAGVEVGQVVTIRWECLRSKTSWLLPWAFAQADLSRAAINLEPGQLVMPGHPGQMAVLVKPLNTIGRLGPDACDVSDAFDFSSITTEYTAYFGNPAYRVGFELPLLLNI